MKASKIIVCLLFALLCLLPVAAFTTEPDSVSDIDNRTLAPNPLTQEGDLTDLVEDYVNDRIGFRSQMITAYTVLNDKLFHTMEHPIYVYGTDGYIYAGGLSTQGKAYTDYHRDFAAMVKEIQNYCTARNVPFVFAFEPAKPAIYSEYLPTGCNYDRSWVDSFFQELDRLGVTYVDNTAVMKQCRADGITVFNQKYDANHWNDWGAFYGINAILKALNEQGGNIHINDISEFNVGETVQTSLQVSKFPIEESVPTITGKYSDFESLGGLYRDELKIDPSYSGFSYIVNPLRLAEECPRAMVFQGSYINGFGYKFLQNSFGEYIAIHDYQNILDFAYYYNLFQPAYVVFEVAEYTIDDAYFNAERVQNFSLQPTFSEADAAVPHHIEASLASDLLKISVGQELTTLFLPVSAKSSAAYLTLDQPYDLQWQGDGYALTVMNDLYAAYRNELQISLLDGDTMTTYSLS